MKHLIRRLVCPWRVSVNWDGLVAMHYAVTFNDATQWAAQYPAGSRIVIAHRIGGIRAARIA